MFLQKYYTERKAFIQRKNYFKTPESWKTKSLGFQAMKEK